ncbi:Cyanase [Abortiporus biennis]|nr:Cyanase [Abortiporus biennis]
MASSLSEPFATLPPICKQLFEAKAAKGLTFDQIGKAIGKDEVWVASAFYGQARLSPEDILKISDLLQIDHSSLNAQLGENWFPHRGLGPMPPTDPVIYRLYEGVMVYGNAIKAILHEKFGDGIMSMIDCEVKVDKKPTEKGDYVSLTFEGKYLQYKKW